MTVSFKFEGQKMRLAYFAVSCSGLLDYSDSIRNLKFLILLRVVAGFHKYDAISSMQQKRYPFWCKAQVCGTKCKQPPGQRGESCSAHSISCRKPELCAEQIAIIKPTMERNSQIFRSVSIPFCCSRCDGHNDERYPCTRPIEQYNQ